MKNENEQDVSLFNLQQQGYPVMYQQDDEIDLFDLFSSIFSRWKLLAVITLVGTLLTVIYVMMIPHQYEATVQIARPTQADIKALNTRGFQGYTPEQIFIKYFDNLRSAEIFKAYLKEGNWYAKFFPEVQEDIHQEKWFAGIYSALEAEIIRTKKINGVDDPVPELVSLKIAGADEENMVKLVNGYVEFTNNYVLRQIAKKGKHSVSLEVESINQEIDELRGDAEVRRKLLISKIEEQDQEKLAVLIDEKKGLLTKAKADRQSKIAMLKEAYDIAKKVGITKLTTLDALATEDKGTKTMVTLGGKGNRIYALMGTLYLASELETLKNRKNDELFIPEISSVNKQIENITHNEKLIALKERKSDDPYIKGLPDLFKRLDHLKRVSFDFSDTQLYRLDQSAFADGIAEKPKRKLIVVIGFVLSGFISLFAVLIINGIKKHKEKEVGEETV